MLEAVILRGVPKGRAKFDKFLSQMRFCPGSALSSLDQQQSAIALCGERRKPKRLLQRKSYLLHPVFKPLCQSPHTAPDFSRGSKKHERAAICTGLNGLQVRVERANVLVTLHHIHVRSERNMAEESDQPLIGCRSAHRIEHV